ncbi:MAG TPA: hypothetical protein VFQ33_13800, partial [Xanthobacteraceae bacterium]|nr:hypothetical protein [Xanthobacteraceae bacterium]
EGAPKFPHPAVFAFLWNQGLRSGRRDLCAAAGFTLDRIAASGLHDHVGGGFFRYTVDAEWKIAQQRAPADRWIAINEPGVELAEGHPARGKTALGGRPTAYVCQGSTCSLPITDPGQLGLWLTAGGP